MKMNIFEKKALYSFGCPNHEATVDRLQTIAAIAPDYETQKFFLGLSVNQTGHGRCKALVSVLLPHSPTGNGQLLRCRADHETGRTQYLRHGGRLWRS